MFGFRNTDDRLVQLTNQIRELSKQVAALKGQRDSLTEVKALEATIIGLKTQISDLEISKAKKEEEFARGERELTHKVGLERKRGEQDIANARREVAVELREQALAAERTQFEQQQAFREKRFDEETATLKGLMEKILERLPVITVDAGGRAKSKEG